MAKKSKEWEWWQEIDKILVDTYKLALEEIPEKRVALESAILYFMGFFNQPESLLGTKGMLLAEESVYHNLPRVDRQLQRSEISAVFQDLCNRGILKKEIRPVYGHKISDKEAQKTIDEVRATGSKNLEDYSKALGQAIKAKGPPTGELVLYRLTEKGHAEYKRVVHQSFAEALEEKFGFYKKFDA